MKTFLAIVGFVVLFGIVAGACISCDDDDHDSFRPVQLASHERNRCYDDCDDDWGRGSGNGNSGYDGEGGRSGDTNQRGDRNCRNVCGNTVTIPMPGETTTTTSREGAPR